MRPAPWRGWLIAVMVAHVQGAPGGGGAALSTSVLNGVAPQEGLTFMPAALRRDSGSPMGRPHDERRMYGDLAWTWPIVSPPERYVREARELRRMIVTRSPAARTLLHLGCGGGHLDRTPKRSFTVTGIAVTPSMLCLSP